MLSAKVLKRNNSLLGAVGEVKPAGSFPQAFLFAKRLMGWSVLICMVYLFSGCSSIVVGPGASFEEALLKSVNEYWQAVVAGNWHEAYTYEYPVLRKTISRDVYVSRRGNPLVRISSYKIEDITFFENGTEASVKLRLWLKLFIPGSSGNNKVTLTVKDKWVKISGKWYHVPKRLRNLRGDGT